MSSIPRHEEQLPPPTPREQYYLTVQQSAGFQDLRHRYRRWVIPVTVVLSPGTSCSSCSPPTRPTS